jgi:hypothetical protein
MLKSWRSNLASSSSSSTAIEAQEALLNEADQGDFDPSSTTDLPRQPKSTPLIIYWVKSNLQRDLLDKAAQPLFFDMLDLFRIWGRDAFTLEW